jgi:putative transposon-encoded protein
VVKNMHVEEFTYTIDNCGNSAHIRMSKKWLGKKVKVRIETVSKPDDKPNEPTEKQIRKLPWV